MRVKFKTDSGEITIDTDNINQFYPIELNRTMIEHDTGGENRSDIVNCSLLQMTELLMEVTPANLTN